MAFCISKLKPIPEVAGTREGRKASCEPTHHFGICLSGRNDMEEDKVRDLTELDRDRITKVMDIINNPQLYPQAEMIFEFIDCAKKGKDSLRGDQSIPEWIEAILDDLLEGHAGAELIQRMAEEGVETIAQALVTYDGMSAVAYRIEQNTLCAIQDILIEFYGHKGLKQYEYFLREKCNYLPANSGKLPAILKAAGGAS